MEDAVEFYFTLCEAISEVRAKMGGDLFDLRHESFIEDPQTHLRTLCEFLGQDAPDDYLDDCASVVFVSPNKSRHEMSWSSALIDTVQARIDRLPFLRGYSYES